MNSVSVGLGSGSVRTEPTVGAAAGRFLWADVIRIWGIIAVVLLHAEAVPNLQFGQIPMDFWWQTNFYASFVCTCVPLFIMLSGALILNQEGWNGPRFLRRRASKLLIPLIGWTLIYAAWYRFVWDRPLGFGDLLVHLVSGITKPLFAHLWFLYLIISLYLMVPVLRIFFRHSSSSLQAYFVMLWFVATGVKPLLTKLFGIDLGLYLDPFFGFVGYFLIGGSIAKFVPERISPRLLALASLALAVGYVVNLVGTYVLSETAGKLDDTLYEHTAPTVMIMTVASFVLLRHLSVHLRRYAAALSVLGHLTFGIYLSHALIIVLLESGRLGFKLYPTMLPPLFGAPLLALVVLMLSGSLTAILQCVPVLRRLAPV